MPGTDNGIAQLCNIYISFLGSLERVGSVFSPSLFITPGYDLSKHCRSLLCLGCKSSRPRPGNCFLEDNCITRPASSSQSFYMFSPFIRAAGLRQRSMCCIDGCFFYTNLLCVVDGLPKPLCIVCIGNGSA